MMCFAAFLLVTMLWVTLMARQTASAEPVLIVGTGPLARRIAKEICRRGRPVFVVVDDAGAVDGSLAPLVAGPLSRLSSIIAERCPTMIVIALADRRGRLPMTDLLRARVRGVIVEDGVECYERLTGKIAIEALTPGALIASRDFRKTHVDLALSHTVSLIVAIGALIVFAPIFAVIAIAITIDSSGPLLFVHDRVGIGGRPIKLLKFRTMRPANGPTSEWECDNRDRVTTVGRWLRRYRLDELPQLINIVRGELNLVGPRPHPASNVDLFSRAIPYYALRSVVRPGLTGWAQIRQGYANGLEEETEKMRYDLYYIKHMSLWLDARILFHTAGAVLKGTSSRSDVAATSRSGRLWRAAWIRLATLRSTRVVGG